MEIDIYRRTNS